VETSGFNQNQPPRYLSFKVVEFSDKAIADLEQIRLWISLDNPRVAMEKAEMLAHTCELLDQFPTIGGLYVDPVRYFSKEIWVIIYRPTQASVYIYRVFDSRRDWRAQLI
jgi:plasmid stabilization system protein ParE